jgi:Protein of unknown function (DUF1580)
MDEFFDSRRYSATQLALHLHVHVATIWRWILRGVRGRKLTTIMVGGRRFVLESDLRIFLAAGSPIAQNNDRELHSRADSAGRQLDAHGVSTPNKNSSELRPQTGPSPGEPLIARNRGKDVQRM